MHFYHRCLWLSGKLFAIHFWISEKKRIIRIWLVAPLWGQVLLPSYLWLLQRSKRTSASSITRWISCRIICLAKDLLSIPTQSWWPISSQVLTVPSGIDMQGWWTSSGAKALTDLSSVKAASYRQETCSLWSTSELPLVMNSKCSSTKCLVMYLEELNFLSFS